MSYTELTFFGRNGKPKFGVEIKNAFRGAMAVWDIMDERYLPPYIPDWAKRMGGPLLKRYRRAGAGLAADDGKPMREVWALFHDDRVSLTDKICMGSTFDWVVVYRADIDKLIEAFRSFSGDSSLPEQAKVIEEAFQDKAIIAVAWNQTSVCENLWDCFKYDDKKDQSIPYNLKTGDKHWNLFDELNKPPTNG